MIFFPQLPAARPQGSQPTISLPMGDAQWKERVRFEDVNLVSGLQADEVWKLAPMDISLLLNVALSGSGDQQKAAKEIFKQFESFGNREEREGFKVQALTLDCMLRPSVGEPLPEFGRDFSTLRENAMKLFRALSPAARKAVVDLVNPEEPGNIHHLHRNSTEDERNGAWFVYNVLAGRQRL